MIQRINKQHAKSSERKKHGFVYHERSPESVKRRAEQTGGRFDSIFKANVDTYRPKVGANMIRFLPPTWDGHDHYGLDVWVHGFIGPNRGSYLCLQKMKNKRCPLCELEAELRKAGENEDAAKIGAKKKVLAWIIDRDGDEAQPQLFLMGWTMDRDISDLVRNKRTGETLLLDHPDEGYDVSFTRKGNLLNTDYFGHQVERSSSPVADKQRVQDEILDYIGENPLPDLLHYVSAEKMEQVVNGVGQEPDEDDEDERPRKSKRRDDDEEEDEDERPRKTKSRSRDEDDDEEEPDNGEEDEEDVRPRKGKARREEDEDEEDERPKTKARRQKEEEEDEDEEDAEDEEDERPSRRRRDDDDDSGDTGASDESDDDEDDRRPRGRSKDRDDEAAGTKRIRLRKSKSKDDDEEDEDDRPSRKKKSRRDDDEDEDDDE